MLKLFSRQNKEQVNAHHDDEEELKEEAEHNEEDDEDPQRMEMLAKKQQKEAGRGTCTAGAPPASQAGAQDSPTRSPATFPVHPPDLRPPVSPARLACTVSPSHVLDV
jgi:hypothetical protein